MSDTVPNPRMVLTLAEGTLAEAAEALNTTDEAMDAPARQYVSHSEPAWDCEQLTVHVPRVQPQLVDRRGDDTCAVRLVATLVVTLVRCLPSAESESPSAEQLNTDYSQLLVDGYTMLKHLTRQWATGMWPEGTLCSAVKWRNMEPRGPGGGYAGWRIEADVTL